MQMEEDVVVQYKPDDFIWDRQFWLSRNWNQDTLNRYVIEKTKQEFGIQ